MPTGPKKGLNAARKVGSGPDNKGLNSYAIASGYATVLGKGDPVKLVSGTLQRATNDTADAIGVFQGVSYTDSNGNTVFSSIWPASTVATDIEALVLDDPGATFRAVGDSSVASVVPGEIYALNLTNADTTIKHSTVDVDIDGGTVAASAGLVKIVSVVDAATNELEVVLVDHDLRDDG